MFPQKGLQKKARQQYLTERKNEIPSWDSAKNGYRIGFPQGKPLEESVVAFADFLRYNSNNSGITTRKKSPLKGTKKIEQDTIAMAASLMHGKNIDGYVTTGGTESNIMALWIAREKLGNKKNTCIVKTPLSHYSIDKAARLLGIKKIVNAELDENYAMSLDSLAKKIKELKKSHYKNFIIVTTAGYTTTGTIDPINEVAKYLKTEKRQRFYHHIDAAIGGFILPFLKSQPKFDFSIEEVDSITLDPHKFGLVPFPAGIFLCRKGNFKYIEQEVSYTHSTDDTLTGSRSGAAATACWTAFNSLGFKGYLKKVKYELEMKKYFEDKIKKYFPQAIIIPCPLPVLAVNFMKPLPRNIENRYRLVSVQPRADEKEKYYKFYFFPNISKKIIKGFFLETKSKN